MFTPLQAPRHSLDPFIDTKPYAHPPAAPRAVDNVSLSLKVGETLGVVGESGCGKSTLGRMIAGILPVSSGERRFRGEPYESFLARKRDALKIQMVFQDPLSSLNPRLRVAISSARRQCCTEWCRGAGCATT
ncbi:ATP-binding cassette domain-containing protein [Rhizobium mesoamericanum]|uniref:ABC transporter domain-containing protein n=1 Tax=Rhizobium mesoamericanum STM3625 TaxID=1211777 RepID=K0Q4J3_9HYPH|nr:ATP-binding cassette domain-containing protein [Rhizobium mesoamericanum]CCM79477.1 hypothetical protein BN77_p10746 [Rhizobium mesoamericanum STM3625]